MFISGFTIGFVKGWELALVRGGAAPYTSTTFFVACPLPCWLENHLCKLVFLCCFFFFVVLALWPASSVDLHAPLVLYQPGTWCRLRATFFFESHTQATIITSSPRCTIITTTLITITTSITPMWHYCCKGVVTNRPSSEARQANTTRLSFVFCLCSAWPPPCSPPSDVCSTA